MAIRTTRRVWEHSKQKGTDLLVLLALADYENESDGFSYPSIAALAKKLRMSQRNLRYVLQRLEDSGELRIERGGGRYHRSRYFLCLPGGKGEEPFTLSDTNGAEGCTLSGEKGEADCTVSDKRNSAEDFRKGEDGFRNGAEGFTVSEEEKGCNPLPKGCNILPERVKPASAPYIEPEVEPEVEPEGSSDSVLYADAPRTESAAADAGGGKSIEEEQGELLPEVAAEEKARLEAEAAHSTQRLMKIMTAIGLYGSPLKGRAYGKQAAVVKRLVEEHGGDTVENAMRGMVALYPYSEGEPWDAFRLEKRFHEAAAKAQQVERAKLTGDIEALPESERERAREQVRKQREEQREKAEALADRIFRRKMKAWEETILERIRSEPKEKQKALWDTAKREVEALPLAKIPEEKKKDMIRNLALTRYGTEIGTPAPRRAALKD